MNLLTIIIFGILLGSYGTHLLYKALKREDGAQKGALIGALVGAVGNLPLLLLFWGYLYWKVPQQLAPSTAGMTDNPALSFNLPVNLPTRYIWRVVIYALLIIMVLVYLLPMYTVITTSLKYPDEAGKISSMWDLPTRINWGSYETALDTFGPKLRNSFILTITATVVSAVMGSLNGYVLAKWRFPGANIIFPMMLFGMFIPYQSILIPLFQFIHDIKLGGTLYGLILAHIVYGLPITTLIFRNYYAEVPDEMLEAGAMDGAGFFGIYRYIVFPLSLPGFVVVIIWQFTQIWNEFLFAITLTVGTKAEPITVALALLAGGEAVNYNLPMAGAMLAAIPTLVVYIVLGRYFIRGLLAGSVKG
jgi:glucose/mannose transport system permease protein